MKNRMMRNKVADSANIANLQKKVGNIQKDFYYAIVDYFKAIGEEYGESLEFKVYDDEDVKIIAFYVEDGELCTIVNGKNQGAWNSYSYEMKNIDRLYNIYLCTLAYPSLISDSKKINDTYVGDWTLWTYDVWGNEEDGFEVNNTFKVVDELTIDIETITDEEILDLLKEFNVVDESATLDDIYIDYMSDAIYIDEADTRKPLCGIVMND